MKTRNPKRHLKNPVTVANPELNQEKRGPLGIKAGMGWIGEGIPSSKWGSKSSPQRSLTLRENAIWPVQIKSLTNRVKT